MCHFHSQRPVLKPVEKIAIETLNKFARIRAQRKHVGNSRMEHLGSSRSSRLHGLPDRGELCSLHHSRGYFLSAQEQAQLEKGPLVSPCSPPLIVGRFEFTTVQSSRPESSLL